jgi:hypothetical protein
MILADPNAARFYERSGAVRLKGLFMSAQHLVREWRTVTTDRGNIDVYVVADCGGRKPAVIMFPEIFGLTIP